MSLGIYSEPNKDTLFTAISPFRVTFDGRRGGAQDRRIYIRNDDVTVYYTDIVLSAVDTIAPSMIDGTNPGFEWKLMEKDFAPTNEEWDTVTAGASLSLSSDLGTSLLADVVSFLSVWVRVQIPSHQPVQTIRDIVFHISAIENLI